MTETAPEIEALKLRISHLQRILDSTADMIITADAQGRIAEFNAQAERILGYPAKTVLGRQARSLFHQKTSYERLIARYETKGIVRSFQTRFRKADGTPVDVNLTLARLKGPAGEPLGFVCVARDVTRHRELEREFRRKSKFLSEIIEHSAVMILTADTKGRLTEVNPEAARVLGYSREEMLGRPAETLYLRARDRRQLLAKVRREGKAVEFDTRFLTKDRSVIDVSLTTSLLKDEEGKPIGIVSIGRNTTQERRLERQLERLSITDSLTRLYNRRFFYRSFLRARRGLAKRKIPLSLILFDVDRFKEWNDKHGHLAGDKVLKAIAKAIHRSVRRNVDIPCRFGGDEFTILLPEADAATALVLAERIRRRFAQMGFGACTLSMGVAQYEKGESVKHLVRRADEAMYAAKRDGGNRVEIA